MRDDPRRPMYAQKAMLARAAANGGVDPGTGAKFDLNTGERVGGIEPVAPTPQFTPPSVPNQPVPSDLPFAPVSPPDPPSLMLAPSPGAPPVQTQTDQAAAELKRLEQELAQTRYQLNLEQQRMVTEARLADLERAELESYRKANEQAVLESAISFDEAELEQLEPEEAKRVALPVIKKMHESQQQLRAELLGKVEENAKLIRSITESTQRAQEMAFDKQQQEIVLRNIPNIVELGKTPEFNKFMNTPIRPNAKTTFKEIISKEYNAGNAQGAVDIIQENFLKRTPSLDSIAQVDTAASPGPTPMPSSQNYDASLAWKSSLLKQLQTGKITRDAYRKALNSKRGVDSHQSA